MYIHQGQSGRWQWDIKKYAGAIAKQNKKLYNKDSSSQSPLTCASASIRQLVTSGEEEKFCYPTFKLRAASPYVSHYVCWQAVPPTRGNGKVVLVDAGDLGRAELPSLRLKTSYIWREQCYRRGQRSRQGQADASLRGDKAHGDWQSHSIFFPLLWPISHWGSVLTLG